MALSKICLKQKLIKTQRVIQIEKLYTKLVLLKGEVHPKIIFWYLFWYRFNFTKIIILLLLRNNLLRNYLERLDVNNTVFKKPRRIKKSWVLKKLWCVKVQNITLLYQVFIKLSRWSWKYSFVNFLSLRVFIKVFKYILSTKIS